MIFLPARGTGLFLPFYIGICMWLVGFFFDKRDFHDPDFTAWVFFYSALITTLHAIRIWLTRHSGHGSVRRSIWHDHFLFIPMLVWPVPLLAISAWHFVR
jgi:hypothetical protein